MYVSVVFVIRCLYCTVSLTVVKEQRLIRIIDYYYFIFVVVVVVVLLSQRKANLKEKKEDMYDR